MPDRLNLRGQIESWAGLGPETLIWPPLAMQAFDGRNYGQLVIDNCLKFAVHANCSVDHEGAYMDALNKNAYATTIRLNDRLIEIYKKIAPNMRPEDGPKIGLDLLAFASEFQSDLSKNAALTPERATQLGSVSVEITQASAAAKAGKGQDVWAALMRAHGCINNVIVDVMGKMS